MDECAYDRVGRKGVRSSSPIDLLAVAVSRSASATEPGERFARDILRRKKLQGIVDLSKADLLNGAGLEDFEAMRVLAAIELGRRAGSAKRGQIDTIAGPQDVAELFEHLSDEKQEHFCALFLNAKNGVIGTKTIHVGTLTMSVVGPREVFREAIREGASSLVVVHNHPSGDPSPSPEDVDVTLKLAEVGRLLDIPLHDHVIVGHHPAWVSLKRNGVI